MSQLLGTIIAAEITSGDTANTWSLGNLNLFQGGHKTASTVSDMNAITNERRLEGMSCWVTTTQQLFRLIGGTNNANWTLDTGGGGGGNGNVDVSARTGADFAIFLASQGTNGVNQVYPIAVAGTTMANLDAVWIGTLNSIVAGISSGNNDPSARAGVGQIAYIANSGTSGANFGIYLASQGTNGVNQVYPIAVAGTTVANLDAQWIGTLTTEVNNTLTWIGTINTALGNVSGADASARAGVGQVEQIANSGTAGANFAIFLASQGTNGVNQLYPIANAGTTVANLDATWIGTLNSIVGGLSAGGNDASARAGVAQVGTIASTGTLLANLAITWVGTINSIITSGAATDVLQVQVFS
jgi:hypothetical protein